MDKRYLQTLEQQGIPIVSTVWLTQGADACLRDILASNDLAHEAHAPQRFVQAIVVHYS